MATTIKVIEIEADTNSVWEKISDTAGISSLIGFISSSEVNGDSRLCTLEGGGELKEKIISVDHDLKRIMYSITASPLGMEFHAASMVVTENGKGTKLDWTVDVAPDSALDQLEPMLDGASADMKKSLAQ